MCYGHVGHTSAICSSLLITCAHRLSERVGNLNFKQLVEGHDIKTSAGGVYFMTKIEINPVSPNITQSISILTAALSLSSFRQHLMGLYTSFLAFLMLLRMVLV